MKKIVMLLMAAAMCGLLSAQIVSIPDANFKKRLITEICADFDGDGILDGDVDVNDDGEIQVSEAESVYYLNTSINVSGIGYMSNSIGLEAFVNLKKLLFYSKVITDNYVLDISNLKKLEYLHYYYDIEDETLMNVNPIFSSENNNLKYLHIENDYYKSSTVNHVVKGFDLSAFPKVETLVLSHLYFDKLDISNLEIIKELSFNFNKNPFPITLGNKPNLEKFSLRGWKNSNDGVPYEVDLSQAPNLVSLFYEGDAMNALNIKNGSIMLKENLSIGSVTINNEHILKYVCADQGEIAMIKEKVQGFDCEVNSDCDLDGDINIADSAFRYHLRTQICADFDGDGKYDADVDANDDGIIQASEAEAVIGLNIESIDQNFIKKIDGIEMFSNLKNLKISVLSEEDSSTYDLTKLSSIESLDINLSYGDQKSSQPEFIIGQQLNLKMFKAAYNGPRYKAGNFTENLSLWPNLKEFNLEGGLSFSSLDFSANQYITKVNVIWPHSVFAPDDINVNNNPLLETVIFKNISFGKPKYEYDLSLCKNLKKVYLHGDNDKIINLKNGVDDSSADIYVEGLSIDFVCVDKIEIKKLDYLQARLSSYCSFVPGGDYYTLAGSNIIDSDTNGCDTNDGKYPSMEFVISGDVDGKYASSLSGDFDIPFEEGNYTITPKLENPDDYSISPESITVTFPQDGDSVTQNFCITPLNQFKDIEIIMLPLSQPQAGKECDYKINFTNKGSVTLSGTIDLTFNDNFMDLVASVPSTETQNPNKLSWVYSNLKPFETKTVSLTMLMNSASDTNFPLNIGERLVFDSYILPEVDDINLENNSFKLVQNVVASSAPNNSICLEGDSIEISEVGDYVYYTINFENTGATAVNNVVVKSSIDNSKFDISTLAASDASHSFVSNTSGNIVEFIFENINLSSNSLLEGENKGYLTFKLKTLSSLKVGDKFNNNSEIYFDTKSPILVSSPQTTVGGALDVTSNVIVSDVDLYPNPISNQLNISSKKEILSVYLLDITGKELQATATFAVKNTTLNLNHLKRGVYFVNVKTENGVTTHKVVKK